MGAKAGAVRSGKAAKGKGKVRRIPSGLPSPHAPRKEKAKDRQSLQEDSFFTGQVQEWRQQWGWILPMQKIDHPMVRKNGGKVFAHHTDARSEDDLEAVTTGSYVEFGLYSDSKGLGAEDWRVLDEVPDGEDLPPRAAAAGRRMGGKGRSRRGQLQEAGDMDEAMEPGEEGLEEGEDAEAEDAEADEGEAPRPDDLKEPLPEGWEAVWSAEHGEWYYWHGATSTSSWTRPDGPPEGAEEAEAEEGAEVVDEEAVAEEEEEALEAAEEEAAEEEPEAPQTPATPAAGAAGGGRARKAEASAPLPDGWEEHFDAEHGEMYYWNRLTKTTTWDRPVAASAPAAAAAAKEPQAKPRGGQVLSRQRVQARLARWDGSSGWAVPVQDLGEDLRPYVERSEYKISVSAEDVQVGHTLTAGSKIDFLLYDDESGLSAIEVRPADLTVAATPAQRAGAGAAGAAKGSAKAAAENGSKGSGKAGAQAAAQAAKAGANGGKAGAKPAAKAAAQAAGKGSAKAAASPKGGVNGRQQQQQQQQEEEPEEAAEEEAEDEGPLLPGWEEVWSEEHQCNYYWHKATRQPSWDRPTAPRSTAAAQVDDAEENGMYEEEGAEEAAEELQEEAPDTSFKAAAGPGARGAAAAGQRARAGLLRPQAKQHAAGGKLAPAAKQAGKGGKSPAAAGGAAAAQKGIAKAGKGAAARAPLIPQTQPGLKRQRMA